MKRGKKRRKPLRGMRIAILGAGRAGRNLALDFERDGAQIHLWSRHHQRSRGFVRAFMPKYDLVFARTALDAARGADVVLICVADRAIAEVATDLAAQWKKAGVRAKPVVLHVSGYHDEKPLAPLRRLGLPVGSMHPVAALPVTWACKSWYAVHGDPKAVAMARKLAGKYVDVLPLRGGAREKREWHLACTLVANGAVALIDLASQLAARHGTKAPRALAGLLHEQGSLLYWENSRKALTGAVTRGDLDVVKGHLAAIRGRRDADLETLYRLLGRRMLDIAGKRVAPADRRKLQRLLRG
jgi:predicted short-subunit dehydrogenase-like oxidoreductase (DUF2520 family)